MSFELQSIKLRRLDKKVWQFKDYEPKRVELAVLDFLTEQGWNGYFTEHFDYDETLIFMMCWPDHNKIGSVTYLDIPEVHHLFYRANDGFIRDEKTVMFSRADLLNNAKNFRKSDISKILALWRAKPRFKKPFIGRTGLKYRHASELSVDHLISYYDAVGGKEYIIDNIEKRFPARFQELLSQARSLTEEVRGRNDLGKMPNLMDSCMSFYNITNAARYPIGKYMSEAGLNRFCENTLKREPRFLAEKIVSLAREIILERHKKDQVFPPIDAVLDLKVWRQNEAVSVEVKAPNDRLSEQQKKQLTRDNEEGKKSFVVVVDEL